MPERVGCETEWKRYRYEPIRQREREKESTSRKRRKRHHSGTFAYAVDNQDAALAVYRLISEWYRPRIMVHFEYQQPWL